MQIIFGLNLPFSFFALDANFLNRRGNSHAEENAAKTKALEIAPIHEMKFSHVHPTNYFKTGLRWLSNSSKYKVRYEQILHQALADLAPVCFVLSKKLLIFGDIFS